MSMMPTILYQPNHWVSFPPYPRSFWLETYPSVPRGQYWSSYRRRKGCPLVLQVSVWGSLGPLQRSIFYLRLSCHHEPALKGLVRNCKTKESPQNSHLTLSPSFNGLLRDIGGRVSLLTRGNTCQKCSATFSCLPFSYWFSFFFPRVWFSIGA